MLPTPSTSHINFDHIYPPSEDSFLLIDTLALPSVVSYHCSRFSSNTTVPRTPIPGTSPLVTTTSSSGPSPSPIILEVGPGSGVVLAFATAHAETLFGRRDVLALGVDINRFACVGTRDTVNGAIFDQQQVRSTTATVRTDRIAFANASHGAPGRLLDVLEGSLASCLRPGSIDILLFNPPYVPSEELPLPPIHPASAATKMSTHDIFTRDSALLALATDGGVDGMEITDLLLAQLPHVLSDRGVAYVLLCAQNRPKQVVETLQRVGWQVEIVRTSGKQGGWEKLCVVRIAKRL